MSRISLKKALTLPGLTDWELVAKLTDEDIENAVAKDPDTVIPTDDELAQFKPAKPHHGDED